MLYDSKSFIINSNVKPPGHLTTDIKLISSIPSYFLLVTTYEKSSNKNFNW